jgi:hypothetical protein
MTDEQPLLGGPRLSSVAGLKKAGILESFHFEPLSGLVGVVYTPAYERILESGMVQLGDPIVLGAVMTDDPVSMKSWVEATAARLPRRPGANGRSSQKPAHDLERSR